MSGFCTCNKTLFNTGIRGVEIAPGVVKKLWLTPMFANDGTRNSLNLAANVQTVLVAAMSNADPSKRIYPVGSFENVESVKGDPLSESFNSGRSVVAQQSPRTFTGLLVKSAQKYLGILESFACTEIGFYIVDSCGNITGLGSDDSTILFPIPVSFGSWFPRHLPATDTTVSKVQLDFQVDLSVNDANLRVVPDGYMRANAAGTYVSALNYLGLTDVFVLTSAPSATGVSFTAKTFAGEAVAGIDVEGLLVADVRIITAAGVVVVPTALTDTGAGSYTATFASQPSGSYSVQISTTYTAGRSAFFGSKGFVIP